jgi:uncharacterized protein YdaU (DUF1376 family)
MAPELSPGFYLFVQDFLTDIRSAQMNYEARGIYISLLCYEWQERQLPTSMRELAALLKLKPSKLSKLWFQLAPCFREEGGHLVNPRLEAERQRQRHREQQQRQARQLRAQHGRAGALARWGKRAGLWLVAMLGQ